MPRRKTVHTSSDLEAQIRRLEEERARLLTEEDRRRGELLRGYLAGTHGEAIRSALAAAIGARDAQLFGLDGTAGSADGAAATGRHRRG